MVTVTGSGQFNGSGNLTVTSSLTATAGSSITLGGTGSITMAARVRPRPSIPTNAITLARAPDHRLAELTLRHRHRGRGPTRRLGTITNAGAMSVQGNATHQPVINNTGARSRSRPRA